MARRRTTFGKMQRDRDKQEKTREKEERRAQRAAERAESGEDDADGESGGGAAIDEAALITALAELHEAYDDGRVPFEEFMSRRDELQESLQQD